MIILVLFLMFSCSKFRVLVLWNNEFSLVSDSLVSMKNTGEKNGFKRLELGFLIILILCSLY
jgi:hypothetical protein